jgi:hypothetical protein
MGKGDSPSKEDADFIQCITTGKMVSYTVMEGVLASVGGILLGLTTSIHYLYYNRLTGAVSQNFRPTLFLSSFDDPMSIFDAIPCV